MLYLVGFSDNPSRPPLGLLDAKQAHQVSGAANEDIERSEQKLERLCRGVYCNQEDLEDLPGFLTENAIRIANYLQPNTALSHVSALRKGAVIAPESTISKPVIKLFVAGHHNHRSLVRNLEIIQNEALLSPAMANYGMAMTDGKEAHYGQMKLRCLSEEIIYLQQFGRRRYNLERFVSDNELDRLRNFLIDKHGDKLDRLLLRIMNETGQFGQEIELALRHLDGASAKTSVRAVIPRSMATKGTMPVSVDDENEVKNVYEFTVGWYQKSIAKIVMNGVTWNFRFNDGWTLPLSCFEDRPGNMPAFIQNLFPEGHQMEALNNMMGTASGGSPQTTVFGQSERYLSNLTIVSDPARLGQITVDALEGRLNDFKDEMGVFQGRLLSMPNMNGRFMGELDRIITDIGITRMSGFQAKIPCNLTKDGDLSPAIGTSFTHILKLPGLSRDPHNLKGALEWAAMSLASGGGLKTCDFAMVGLESGVLAYVCERFDIPTSEDDMRMIYAEDFCAAGGKSPLWKTMAEKGVEDLIDTYKSNATPNTEDSEQLFRLIYTNYVLENGDFHLKNASLVRVANPNLVSFRSTRLSPAFDIMNTRYFADLPLPPGRREPMILEFREKGENLTLEDFEQIGECIGLDRDRVEELMYETTHGIAEKAQELLDHLPDVLDQYPKVKTTVIDCLQRATMCCHKEFKDIPSVLDMPEHLRAPDENEPQQAVLPMPGLDEQGQPAHSGPGLVVQVKKALKNH